MRTKYITTIAMAATIVSETDFNGASAYSIKKNNQGTISLYPSRGTDRSSSVYVRPDEVCKVNHSMLQEHVSWYDKVYNNTDGGFLNRRGAKKETRPQVEKVLSEPAADASFARDLIASQKEVIRLTLENERLKQEVASLKLKLQKPISKPVFKQETNCRKCGGVWKKGLCMNAACDKSKPKCKEEVVIS